MQKLPNELPVMLEACINIQQKYVFPVTVMCSANMALFECGLTKAEFIFLCYIQYFDNM
jgi:hypothetical protein